MISRTLIAAVFAVTSSLAWSESSGPQNGHASDPPTSLNCTACHSGTANSGDGNFTIIGLPSFYTPSRTYELSLLLDKNATGYGFQAIAKDVNNTAGSFTPVSSGITVDGEYIEHNTPSTTGQWTFKWTAPSTDVGLVTFYASGLVANSDAANTGDSVYTLTADMNSSSSQNIPQVQDLVWSQPTRGAIYSSPTIGSDGTIYVGSGDDKLYAFYPDGGVKWSYQAGEWVDSTPAIADDGTVYVGSWDNKVHAVNPDGTGKWTFSTDSLVLAGPAVGPDGTIYVGSHDNFFYALEANGSEKWEYFAEQPISSSAALGQDGTIYFGDDNGTFHAVNPDGTSKWTYIVDTISESNSSIESSPALDLYGNIYFGSANGYCYSLEDNGTNGVLQWKYATGDRVDSSPVLGLSNEVFFMSRDGYLRSIDIDFGVANWEIPVGDVFYSSPVVDENGTVYVVAYAGLGQNHIFAIDANGSMDWNSSMDPAPFVIGDVVDSSLAIDSNGTLYFGSFDKKLYAIKAGWNLADSDWPKFRRDLAGTGRWPSYQIDANASPTEGGVITGAGVYNQGANATIYATPSIGYTFSHWSGSGVNDPNDANTTVPMTEARSVTAHFTINSYVLNISAGTAGGDLLTGDGNYTHGTDANITATPQTGYSFTSWTGDGIADVNASATTVDMTQDRNLTATFTINSYVLNVSAGTVGGDLLTGDGNYTHGTDANITATPQTGYTFASWTGDGIADVNASTTTVDMTQDRNLTATFTINRYALTVNGGTGGTASGSGTFDYNSSAPIEANASEGYEFTGWTGTGITNPADANTTVLMTQDRNVTATFLINSYSLTTSFGSGGSVSSSGTHTHGNQAPITAYPQAGYSFSGWSGAGIADLNATTTTVDMTQDRNASATFSINRHLLAVSVETGGTISGSGTFDWNSSVPILANVSTGYQFTGWTGAGVSNPSDANTTVLMTQDRNVTATFLINSYALSVSADTAGGNVSASGTHNYGTQATITATPQTGYSFTDWTGDGIADLNATTTTVDMTQDRNASATFSINRHVLTVSAETGGSASGSGTFDWNSSVAITATANTGYEFTGWTGSGISDANSTLTTVAMTEDHNVTANFQLKAYALTITGGTGGTATGSGTFTHGTNANVTATANPGHHFTGWSGIGVSEANSSITTVSVTQARNITANFSINRYHLNVSAGTNGSAIGSGTFDHGDQATVTATPQTGYEFADWIGDGVTDVNASATTVDMTQDRNVSANFAISRMILTVTVSAGTGGTTTGSGTYDYNSSATITAMPEMGYDFAGWTGAGVSNSSDVNATVQMSQDRNITANFVAKTYALTVTAGTGGSTTGSGTFTHGTDANVTATPVSGYVFAGWTGDGLADLNAPATSVNMTQDRNVSATFTPQVFQLQLTSTIGGSTSGDGNFSYGTVAPITAVPDSSYYFTGWSGTGIADTNSLSTEVSITQDRNVTANFALVPANQKILQTFADPIGSGSTSGGGSYEENSSVTLSANAGSGFHFLGWSISGGTLTSPLSANSASVRLDQNSDANATAHFTALNRELDLVATIGGSVSGDGNYSHGETVSIIATADTSYNFSEWEVNGTMNFTVTTAPRQYETSANAFFINGVESPPLVLVRGNLYQFDLDGSTTANHPFYFSTDSSGGGNSYIGEFLDGVTNSQATSGTVTIVVDTETPSTIYFNCGNHAGMGNVINIINPTGLVGNAQATTADVNASYVLRANFSLNQHLLTVNAGTGGNVAGGGIFYYGTEANITATPDAGYAFAGWTGIGVASPTSATTTVHVNGDSTFTANFEIAQYALSLVTEPAEGGSVGGAGTYTHGTTVSISAIPATGYRFTHWTGGSPTDANASATTQTLATPTTLTAVFEKLAYSVTASTSPVGSGTVSGSGTHLHGDTITLTAAPAAGYQFDQWTGTSLASPNSSAQTITATENLALTAVFSPKPIQVNVFSSGPGTTTGSQTTAFGQTVSVQAIPSNGAYFFGWQVTGAIVTDPSSISTSVFLSDDVTEVNATAFFATNPHKLVLTVEGNGSVSGSGTYEKGSSIPIAATPSTGHQFTGWELNGTVEYVVTVASRQLTAGQNAYYLDNRESPDLTLVRGVTYKFIHDGNTTVVHPFFLTTEDDNSSGFTGEYIEGVTGSGTTSGSLTFTPDSTTPDSLRYRCGTHPGMGGVLNIIDINSLPSPASPTITMDADLSLRAKFTIKNHNLTVLAGSGGTADGTGTYAYGTDANVTAEPNVGYVFNGWTGASVASPTSATTYIHLTDDTNITANFAIAQYTLSLTSEPPEGGEVAGEGQFDYGATNAITAIPATGYQFTGWSGGTPADANASSTTIILSEPTTLTAKFEKILYEVQVTVIPAGASTISGTGFYELDENVTLSVIPIKGYEFSHWSGAILTSYASQTQTVTVTGNLNLVVTCERHIDAGTLSYALDATELEAGWKESSWFGQFHQATPDWAYHIDFGWIFTKPENESSMWFWTQKLGWLWTNKDVYPHVWRQDSYDWNYFSRLSDGTFAYYDYTSSSWQRNLDIFEVKVVAFPSYGGTVSSGGSFKEYSVATFTATPAEGYVFKRWFGDASGTSTSLSLSVSGELIIYAEFEKSSP